MTTRRWVQVTSRGSEHASQRAGAHALAGALGLYAVRRLELVEAHVLGQDVPAFEAGRKRTARGGRRARLVLAVRAQHAAPLLRRSKRRAARPVLKVTVSARAADGARAERLMTLRF
jgi:hypothetical protein